MFFLASPRCAAGEPVSLGSVGPGKPLVFKEGRRAMVWFCYEVYSYSFSNTVIKATAGKEENEDGEHSGNRRRRGEELPSHKGIRLYYEWSVY
jgi:hypothetical protein